MPPADRAPQTRDLADVTAELLARAPEADIRPSLDRVARLVHLLGDPHRIAPVVHVTGTNGKSSTARMIAAVLGAAGLRVGLFTSPHLHEITERISVDGAPLSAQRFVAVYEEVLPYIDMVDDASAAVGDPPMTFFEVLTGMAFAAFADAPVDAVVLEVGLGGVWDATNVADAKVAVVTPIDLDHTAWLGSTVEAIAAEKAGVIKAGATAVLGAQPAGAAGVLERRCAEVAATVVRAGSQFGVLDARLAVGGQVLDLQGVHDRYHDLFLPLFGNHQADNAAIAVAACEAFLGPVAATCEIIAEGLQSVRVPGRLEIVRRSPTVVVDAAHNPAGMVALVEALPDSVRSTSLIVVLAAYADKDLGGILEVIAPAADTLIVTRNSSPRAASPQQLAALAADLIEPERLLLAPDIAAAVDVALARADAALTEGGSPTVLATGSVATVADERALLGADRRGDAR